MNIGLLIQGKQITKKNDPVFDIVSLLLTQQSQQESQKK
jgi:hypothetical protein